MEKETRPLLPLGDATSIQLEDNSPFAQTSDDDYYDLTSSTGSLSMESRYKMASLDGGSFSEFVDGGQESDEESAPSCLESTKMKLKSFFCPPPKYYPRTIDYTPGARKVTSGDKALPKNEIHNQKYNPYTFIFVVLYNEFKFFFNLYFLLVALSQFIPQLKIGYLFTYVSPLVFVLSITIAKEAYDDYGRYKRDREANSQKFQRLTKTGFETIPSSEIAVGDFIQVSKDERIPADMVLLRTADVSGSCFIRTDQLDGESEWRLRKAPSLTQKFPTDVSLHSAHISVYAEAPGMDIYRFVGTLTQHGTANKGKDQVEGLSLDNTLWMNTVLASSTVIGCVTYTGPETRSVMNTSEPATKVGLLDFELNRLAKVLFCLVLILSVLMVALGGFKGYWAIDIFRFVLLFSSIIPISLRVNLDMGKALYSYWINHDDEIEGTVVRTSTIPEQLGRINYLLSDKTGTLTQNDMIFKRLHLGSVSFSADTVDDLEEALKSAFSEKSESEAQEGVFGKNKRRTSTRQKVRTIIESLALCHSVTPTYDEDTEEKAYQASSPDEVALVKFTETLGLSLYERTLTTLTLETPFGKFVKYDILYVFPFSSDTKRMGIILREQSSQQILFYMKGADVVMARIVKESEWLDEECGNMAREGLRTLVFGMKVLSEEEYQQFDIDYKKAKASVVDRDKNVQSVVEGIEMGLELIGLSGVEDLLQEKVKPTLEMLRNAGIKIWMLTGDKIETATNIAISARLVSPHQSIFTISKVVHKREALTKLNVFKNKLDACLVIDGDSLKFCMDHFRDLFAEVATKAPAVVCCRCSPTQKADVVLMIKDYTQLQTAAIGDGGNDVSMIQAADVGIGIVGKEGKQASLAADFSIEKFNYVARLMLWHGRNSYKRSARLGQFIIHRGLIISFIQAVFSALFYFAAIAIYSGWLLVGYATWYTTGPVFSLVLDSDKEDIVFQYPELYRELQKGRALSFKTFFVWVAKSIYQGGTIMLLAMFLFDQSLSHIVTITFTALIFTELINVCFEINNWHFMMVISQVVAVVIYFISIYALPSYFTTDLFSVEFLWKISVMIASSTLPVFLVEVLKKRLFPTAYSKLL